MSSSLTSTKFTVGRPSLAMSEMSGTGIQVLPLMVIDSVLLVGMAAAVTILAEAAALP